VFEKEPPDAQNPLFRFQNVILTPHTAALTKDGVIQLAEGAADNALRVLAGLKPTYSPNWEIVQAKRAPNEPAAYYPNATLIKKEVLEMAKKAKTKSKIWTYAMEEMSYPDVQAILKTTDVVLILSAARRSMDPMSPRHRLLATIETTRRAAKKRRSLHALIPSVIPPPHGTVNDGIGH